jgi:hypothetical protein
LHPRDVLGSGVTEPGNATGLPAFVPLRASPVEPSRFGKVLSKPRKGVAKRGAVNFWNVESVSQAIRHLKDAQFQPGSWIAFGDDESNKAWRHICRCGKALAGDPYAKRRKDDGFVQNGIERVTKSVQ